MSVIPVHKLPAISHHSLSIHISGIGTVSLPASICSPLPIFIDFQRWSNFPYGCTVEPNIRSTSECHGQVRNWLWVRVDSVLDHSNCVMTSNPESLCFIGIPWHGCNYADIRWCTGSWFLDPGSISESLCASARGCNALICVRSKCRICRAGDVQWLWAFLECRTIILCLILHYVTSTLLGTVNQHRPMILPNNYWHQSKPTSLHDIGMGVMPLTYMVY